MNEYPTDSSGPTDDSREHAAPAAARFGSESVVLARPVRYDLLPSAIIPFGYALQPLPVRPPSPINLSIPWWRCLLELFAVFFVVITTMIAVGFAAFLYDIAPEQWEVLLVTGCTGLAGTLTVLLVMALARHKPVSIGLTWKQALLNAIIGASVLPTFYMVAFCVLIVALILLGPFLPNLIEEEPEHITTIKETFPPMSLAMIVPLMAFVAFWEEIVFRGFLLTRLKPIVRHWLLAIPLGALIFALCHAYQGIGGIVMTFIMGNILGILFVWRRSLVPCIVYHALNNIVAFMMIQTFFIDGNW